MRIVKEGFVKLKLNCRRVCVQLLITNDTKIYFDWNVILLNETLRLENKGN